MVYFALIRTSLCLNSHFYVRVCVRDDIFRYEFVYCTLCGPAGFWAVDRVSFGCLISKQSVILARLAVYLLPDLVYLLPD